MRELSYGKFSLRAHQRLLDSQGPTDCQFELTFGCDYRCRHCFTTCFDRKDMLKKELGTMEVLAVLEKMRAEGILWLCLTGGDPLFRPDFPDIYAASRRMGFVTTVFTNGYRVDHAMAGLWKRMPPFAVEMTVNAASEGLYDRISGVPGSFSRVLRALDLLREADVPVKLKMQVTTENVRELPLVRAWARERGLALKPNFLLHPRLDGDQAPCSLRVPLPGDASRAENSLACGPGVGSKAVRADGKAPLLFPCALGSGSRWHVDPYGNGFMCCLLRKPRFDLLTKSLAKARREIMDQARDLRYRGKAACPSCSRRGRCVSCPGLAFLEARDPEAVVPYYCGLAGSR